MMAAKKAEKKAEKRVVKKVELKAARLVEETAAWLVGK